MACEHCGGNCATCSGCAATLELTEGELHILSLLGQYSFLPVARRADDMTPIFLEDDRYSREHYSLVLQCLEKKQLIRIDYDGPLTGSDMSAYRGLPVQGSMALTQRGYTVLDILETQGIG